VSGLAEQIAQRLRLTVAQGIARLVSAKTVQAEVLDAELLPNVQRVEPYGLSYRPKPGAEVYMVFPSGDRALGIALIVGDKRYQLDLQEGEVALHDDSGNFVKLGKGGVATVKASTSVTIDTPILKTTGSLEVAGGLTVGGATTLSAGADVAGDLKNNGKFVGSTHTHTSSPPGQITSTPN